MVEGNLAAACHLEKAAGCLGKGIMQAACRHSGVETADAGLHSCDFPVLTGGPEVRPKAHRCVGVHHLQTWDDQ